MSSKQTQITQMLLEEKVAYLHYRLHLRDNKPLHKKLRKVGFFTDTEWKSFGSPEEEEEYLTALLNCVALKGEEGFAKFCVHMASIDDHLDLAWELLQEVGLPTDQLPKQKESLWANAWSNFKKLRDYFQGVTSFNLVVCGKSGIGKSTLINALVGSNICKTGHSVKGVTRDVDEAATFDLNGVKVRVWDTPGLEEGSVSEQEERKKQLRKKITQVDLFLLCRQATDIRVQEADKRVLKTVTGIFGPNVWKKSVIVMTMGNMLMSVPEFEDAEDDDDRLELLETQRDETLEEYKSFLLNSLDVPAEVCEAIPAVVAGHPKKKFLVGKNWVKRFWIACYKRADPKQSRAALLKVNRNRLVYTREDAQSGEGDAETSESSQASTGSEESRSDVVSGRIVLTKSETDEILRPVIDSAGADIKAGAMLGALLGNVVPGIGSVFGTVVGAGVGAVYNGAKRCRHWLFG